MECVYFSHTIGPGLHGLRCVRATTGSCTITGDCMHRVPCRAGILFGVKWPMLDNDVLF